jgi:hypothetical protein
VENFIAHFSAEEQASVRLVFQTHEYNIQDDFGLAPEIDHTQAEKTEDFKEQLTNWVAQARAQV